MTRLILVLALITSIVGCAAQSTSNKSISKNNMTVSWHYQGERIYFEMSAPTDGWVTIGFNSSTTMTGAYLLMGNIVNGKASVVEHATLSPGNYKKLTALGSEIQVEDVEGSEKGKNTQLKFSLPISAFGKYQKDLAEGQKYTMILAYSREDDFQHHSMMRTSAEIEL